MARYGLWSDCGEWSDELLSEWRAVGFDKQKEEALARGGGYENDLHVQQQRAQICREQVRACRHEVHWAAVADLQQRINRYLVRVML